MQRPTVAAETITTAMTTHPMVAANGLASQFEERDEGDDADLDEQDHDVQMGH